MKKIYLLSSSVLLSLNAFTQSWDKVGDAPNSGANVYTLLADTAKGVLYAGGDFASFGSTGALYVAQWDGSFWAPMGASINSSVWALGTYKGELVAGGDFSFTGVGGSVNGIAIYNKGKWNGLEQGIGSGQVSSILEFGGNLYAGGTFAVANGLPMNNIAMWDGIDWFALDEGIAKGNDYHPEGFLNAVDVLKEYKGDLYAGGWFYDANTLPVRSITKWNGSTWEDLQGGCNGFIFAMEVYNNELYVGGLFDSIGNIPAYNIAKWDGSTWTAVGGGIATTYVLGMAVLNGELYVGGEFADAGGVSVSNVAKWDGSQWADVGGGTDSGIGTMTADQNYVYCSGTFTTAGGQPIETLARWGTPVGMQENTSQKIAVNIYPNPFTNQAFVKIAQKNQAAFETMRFQLYDDLGRMVKSIAWQDRETLELKREELASGIYFYRLSNDQNVVLSSGKVVVE